MNYFSYKTNSEISVYHPSLLSPPVISFCVYVQPLISDAIMNNFDHEGNSIVRMKVNISLNNVFRLTPKHTDIMLRCGIFTTTGRHLRRNGHECNQLFNFSRYFMESLQCYMFERKEENLYDFQRIAREGEGVVYGFWLNTTVFKNHTYFKVIMHDKGLPFTSRYFAGYIPGPHAVGGRGLTYHFSYAIIEHKKLPPPYETNCVKEADWQPNCHLKCAVESIEEQFNRLTSAWPLSESNDHNFNYDLPLLYNTYKMKESQISTYNSLLHNCSGKCKRDPCEVQFSQTSLQAHFESDQIEMWFQLPVTPTMKLAHSPFFVMNDYIIYVMSCLGTWLGLSVIAMNPFKFLESYNSRQNNCNCNSMRSCNRSRVYERLCRLESKYYRMSHQQEAMKLNFNQKLEKLGQILNAS